MNFNIIEVIAVMILVPDSFISRVMSIITVSGKVIMLHGLSFLSLSIQYFNYLNWLFGYAVQCLTRHVICYYYWVQCRNIRNLYIALTAVLSILSIIYIVYGCFFLNLF